MAKRAFGKWKIVGTIGEGGQAQVYLAVDTTGQAPGQFALKPLRNSSDEILRKRFEQEVRATLAIGHRNILRIYESALATDRPYYVAEYCEGGSLDESEPGRFFGDMRATAAVLLPVINALVAAHERGVYHRDMKPANILFRKDGTPVVGDFGICHVKDGVPLTLSDKAMGSRHFIAPEMEAARHHLGGPSDRTDVYSLGKVLYWMLSGGRVFDREDHRARGNSLIELLGPPKWEHVHLLLDKMIVEKPLERLHSHEVKEALTMTQELVEGNFAPLKPSGGIQCRFCGIGKYERFAAFSDGGSTIDQGMSRVGLFPIIGPFGTNVRVLRCSNCGHIEWFQFDGIKSHGWWDQ